MLAGGGEKGPHMSIRFACSGCGRTIHVPDGSEGKKARCPSCKAVVTVPAPSAAEDEGPIRLAEPEEPAPSREADESESPAAGPRMQSCAVCGSSYPIGQTCPRCRPRRQMAATGGGFPTRKILTILVILIAFGGLMAVAGYIIKNMAETGHEYTSTLIETKERATEVSCEMNLSSIYKSLKIAAAANEGKFPATLEDLGYASDQLRCPAKNGDKYIYISGQNESSAPKNVLVYELAPAHEGKCNVLRVDGSISVLTPQQVSLAIAATRGNMTKAKK